jgi:hypothetical protein
MGYGTRKGHLRRDVTALGRKTRHRLHMSQKCQLQISAGSRTLASDVRIEVKDSVIAASALGRRGRANAVKR